MCSKYEKIVYGFTLSNSLNKIEISSIQSYLNDGYRFYLYSYENIQTEILGEYYLFSAHNILDIEDFTNIRKFKKLLKEIKGNIEWCDLRTDIEGNRVTRKSMKKIKENKKVWIVF